MSVPITNGVHAPFPSSTSLSTSTTTSLAHTTHAPNKRKRTSSNLGTDPSGNRPAKRVSTTPFDDILQILRARDLSPSLLDRPLHAADVITTSQSPSSKRTKLKATAHVSIALKVGQKAYQTLEELQTDVDDACASLRKAASEPNIAPTDVSPDEAAHEGKDAQAVRLVDSLVATRRIDDFASLATNLISKASRQIDRIPNGVKVEGPQETAYSRPSRSIISVFGNASIPKQLFSSLQCPPDGESVEQVDMPLEELGLPNMMSASRLMSCPHDPTSSATALDSTFGKVFAPPSTVLSLNAPRPYKPSTQRNPVITFSETHLLGKSHRANGYTVQPLRVGRWLAYGDDHVDSAAGLVPGQSKRTHRESSAGNKVASSTDIKVVNVNNVTKERDLLRLAYSSFAPSHDDTHAVLPQRDLNTVWWKRYGARRFLDRFSASAESAATSSFEQGVALKTQLRDEHEAHQFKSAVEEFDQGYLAETLLDDTSALSFPALTSTDDLLALVAGLIQTLSAQQEIRNSQLPNDPRSAAASETTSNVPTPEEVETYNNLRARLAELISRMPPYMLAKRDGEQYEQLCLSTRLRIPGKQYSGVLEEDKLTRMAKSAAAATAALAAAPAKPQPSYASSQSYSKNPSLAQSAIRAARSNNPYTRAAPGANLVATPITAGSTRPSYTNAAYSAPVGRPSSSQYGSNNALPSAARGVASSQSNGISTTQTGSPVAGRSSSFSRAPSHSLNTNSAGVYGTAMAASGHQSRPSSAITSAGATHHSTEQKRPSPTVPQGGFDTPRSAQSVRAPSNLGPTGFHTSMTTEQQQTMMERQRAQLAAQPQARMTAQADTLKAQQVQQAHMSAHPQTVSTPTVPTVQMTDVLNGGTPGSPAT